MRYIAGAIVVLAGSILVATGTIAVSMIYAGAHGGNLSMAENAVWIGSGVILAGLAVIVWESIHASRQ